MEDSTIKAQYIYYVNDNIKFDNFSKFKNVTDLFKFINKEYEYKYGDLVSFSEYRDTETYIIGKEGKLIKNPDYSAAGYLTIPYEITKYLDDAFGKYSELLEDFPSDLDWIDLRFDDKFIKENINTKSCKILEKWDWKFSYCININELHITFPNNIKKIYDVKKTSANKILKWYNGSKLDQTTIEVNFKLKKDDSYNKNVPKLPPTWDIEISSSYNREYKPVRFFLKGPTIDKDKVINSINRKLKNLEFEITEL